MRYVNKQLGIALEMAIVWCESVPRGRRERFLCRVLWGPIGQRALGQLCGGTIRSLSKPEASKYTKTRLEWLKNLAEWRKQWLHEQQNMVHGKKKNCARGNPGERPSEQQGASKNGSASECLGHPRAKGAMAAQLTSVLGDNSMAWQVQCSSARGSRWERQRARPPARPPVLSPGAAADAPLHHGPRGAVTDGLSPGRARGWHLLSGFTSEGGS